ncbi:MAG: sigma-70 family RNA polymerase sigma factor [Candidatus Geothermincolales bacterium]
MHQKRQDPREASFPDLPKSGRTHDPCREIEDVFRLEYERLAKRLEGMAVDSHVMEADDFLQEAFCRVLSLLEEGRLNGYDRKYLVNLVFRIARNLMVDEGRRAWWGHRQVYLEDLAIDKAGGGRWVWRTTASVDKGASCHRLDLNGVQHGSSAFPDPEDAIVSIEKAIAVLETLKEMSERDISVLACRMEGMGWREIAEALGMTEGSARVRYHRLKEKIKRVLHG